MNTAVSIEEAMKDANEFETKRREMKDSVKAKDSQVYRRLLYLSGIEEPKKKKKK